MAVWDELTSTTNFTEEDDLLLKRITLGLLLSFLLLGQARAQSPIEDLVPLPYRHLVYEVAAEFELDPRLLASVGWVESRWREGRSGSAGEIGLLQILPSTAEWIAVEMALDSYDLSNPVNNLRMAAWYLRHNIDTQGSVEGGLAAYNGGPRYADRAPVAARAYVDLVRRVQNRVPVDEAEPECCEMVP